MSIGGRERGLQAAIDKLTEDYKKLGIKHAKLLKKCKGLEDVVSGTHSIAPDSSLVVVRREELEEMSRAVMKLPPDRQVLHRIIDEMLERK